MAPASDGAEALFILGFVWTAFWIFMFYLLSFTFPKWGSILAQSTKPHENDRYWIARNILGIFHAIFVSALALVVLLQTVDKPEPVWFAASVHLATCEVDQRDPVLAPWTTYGEAIALAGLMFTTFTIMDLIVSPIHKLMTIKDYDFLIHHAAFIGAGLVIRGHCMLPFNAAVLILMELSTPFLNYFVLVRHRGEAYKNRVIVSGILFFATFLVLRIGLNTYATVVLWVAYFNGEAMSPLVPRWQAWFLLLAITAGAVVQIFWLPGICKSFGSRLASLFFPSDRREALLQGGSHEGAAGGQA